MMKKISRLLVVAMALLIASCASMCDKAECKTKPRKIAVQMWSLHDFTLADALKQLQGVGTDAIECFPGQRIGGKYPNAKLQAGIKPEELEYAKKLIKDAGFKVVSFGVTLPRGEDAIKANCELAKALGAKRILTEARVIDFPIWDKYCQQYGLIMCLHHHALDAPNQYYDAYVVNKYTKPYKNIMGNPDIGHLVRSNISAVDTIKQLKGNIGSIHTKDENAFGKIDSKACVLGKGYVNMPAVLKELDKQGYDGYFVIEYEDDWGKNVPHIKACIEYLKNN